MARFPFAILAIALIIMGCQHSTAPTPGPSASPLLSFQVDSLHWNLSSGIAYVGFQIHNGTGSTVTFAACCRISLRLDQLQDTTWSLGTPGWETACPAMCSPSFALAADSTYTDFTTVRQAGTYRLVVIYGEPSQSGLFPNTLMSNNFDVR